MKEFLISVDVTKNYHITIEAETESQAIHIAERMQTTQIYEEGSLQVIDTPNVECIDKDSEE